MLIAVNMVVNSWEKSQRPSQPGRPAPSKTAASSVRDSAALNQQRKAVENYFKSDQEPVAKDALWTTDSIFKVGVLDDGSSRRGYAMYVCEVLSEHGFRGRGVWVQVIDIAKLVDTKKWVKLGEAHCA